MLPEGKITHKWLVSVRIFPNITNDLVFGAVLNKRFAVLTADYQSWAGDSCYELEGNYGN